MFRSGKMVISHDDKVIALVTNGYVGSGASHGNFGALILLTHERRFTQYKHTEFGFDYFRIYEGRLEIKPPSGRSYPMLKKHNITDEIYIFLSKYAAICLNDGVIHSVNEEYNQISDYLFQPFSKPLVVYNSESIYNQ